MTERDLTPREAMNRYLDHRTTEASESSIKSYRYRLKLFDEWCEENEICTVSALDGWVLDQYETYRRGCDLSPATLNGEMQTLKNWMEYLSRVEVVDEDLPEKVHVPQVSKEQESNDEMLEPERAFQILQSYRNDPVRYGSKEHALLELLWFTGARMGSIRALDLEDYHSDDQFLEFRHRPETGTPLKNDRSGERAVGLPETVCDVVDTYISENRDDAYENGRQPLFGSSQGRPAKNTIRVWCYMATQPCLHLSCPHGEERDECSFVHFHHASKCPSSVSPHRIRTGSITWQRDCGLPAEIVAERVNATLEVIERYYDKASERERLERRRRPYLDNLQLGEVNH
jgi:site-specific recombinase XerD